LDGEEEEEEEALKELRRWSAILGKILWQQ
jgi:hypothetical protein